MNAYSVAAELLGDLELGSGQRAQLRAIDYRYQLEVQRRLQARAPGGAARTGDPLAVLTSEDLAFLRTLLLADIRDMLTPEQRAVVDRR